MGMRHIEHAEILDNETVRADTVQIRKKPVHPFCFRFLEYGINRDKNFLASAVERFHGSLELRPGKVCGPDTGIETFQSQIDRVRSFPDCRVECFGVSRRSQ